MQLPTINQHIYSAASSNPLEVVFVLIHSKVIYTTAELKNTTGQHHYYVQPNFFFRESATAVVVAGMVFPTLLVSLYGLVYL